MTSFNAASRLRQLFGVSGTVFAFFIVMLGTTVPTPLYPLYRQEFGFSEPIITVIFAVYAVGVIGALLGMGRWSDQIGRRPMLLAGLGCAALSDVILAQADGLSWLLLGRLISGVSAGIYTGAATVSVIELMPERWRAHGPLVAVAANLGGQGLGPLFAAQILQDMPDPLVAPYLSHLVLAVIGAVLILIAPETVNKPARPKLQMQRLDVPPEVRPVFVPAATAAFAGFMVAGFFTAVSPAFLGEVLGRHSAILVGLDVASFLLMAVLGQMLLPLFPPHRRLPIGVGLLLAGVLVLGAGLGLAQLSVIVVGAMIAGVGNGLVLRAGLGRVAQAAPVDERAAVTSTFFTVSYVALSLPVVGVGVASAVFGLYASAIGFAAIAALLCLITLVLLAREGRSRVGD
jgi:MFS family permease